MQGLKDKVVLISGTAGGQGRAAALAFAREGAKVFGSDVKTAEAEETVEMVKREAGSGEGGCEVVARRAGRHGGQPLW